MFYFDGKEIRRVKNDVCHYECALLLSEAILKWAGPVGDAIDGTFMEVDYVRAYGAPGSLTRSLDELLFRFAPHGMF